jgi:hypothetical protein
VESRKKEQLTSHHLTPSETSNFTEMNNWTIVRMEHLFGDFRQIGLRYADICRAVHIGREWTVDVTLSRVIIGERNLKCGAA